MKNINTFYLIKIMYFEFLIALTAMLILFESKKEIL
jgi:hypothetical protein